MIETFSIGRVGIVSHPFVTRLTDDSVKRIIERMKLWSLRVKHLDLDSNSIGTKGLTALVEYVWNCPEAGLCMRNSTSVSRGKGILLGQ